MWHNKYENKNTTNFNIANTGVMRKWIPHNKNLLYGMMLLHVASTVNMVLLTSACK